MKRVLPLGLLLSLAVACTAEAPGSSGNPPTGGNTAGTGGQAGAPAGSGGQSGSGGSPVAGSGGSGGSGGSSGSGGSAPSGGSGGSARADAGRADGRTPDGRPRDAASGADRARTADAGASDVSAAVPSDGFGGGPLTECPTPSIGRLQQWQAHANTVPATGSLLVREGNQYVAKVRFPGGPWSEVVVPIANNEAMTANLTMSKGFTIRYSATADPTSRSVAGCSLTAAISTWSSCPRRPGARPSRCPSASCPRPGRSCRGWGGRGSRWPTS